MIPQLINQLKQNKTPLKEGCNFEELKKLEKILDYKLPNDFIEFYRLTNGYDEDCSFEKQRIWDIERITSEFLEYNDEYVRFSDFMINAPWIGFSKKDGKIYIGAGLKNEFYGYTDLIANNFSEFIELIISNSDKLY